MTLLVGVGASFAPLDNSAGFDGHTNGSQWSRVAYPAKASAASPTTVTNGFIQRRNCMIPSPGRARMIGSGCEACVMVWVDCGGVVAYRVRQPAANAAAR